MHERVFQRRSLAHDAIEVRVYVTVSSAGRNFVVTARTS